MGYDMKITILYIIICLSYIFLSDKFAYLISYAESKTRPPSAPNVVICFFVRVKKLYHPHDLVIWVFLPGQKCCITHVTHYHTFCAPQEWYVLESHVSITYTKWTYFLVNYDKYVYWDWQAWAYSEDSYQIGIVSHQVALTHSPLVATFVICR